MKLTPDHARHSLRWPLALAINAVVLTSACSSTPANPAPPASPSPSASPSASASAAPPSEDSSPPSDDSGDPAQQGVGKIGGGAIDAGGDFKVAVSKPQMFTSEQLAFYEVTVENHGSAPVDLTNTAVTALDGDSEAELVNDARHPAADHFTGTLLPGKKQTASYTWLVSDNGGASQIEVFVGDSGRGHAVFTSGQGTT